MVTRHFISLKTCDSLCSVRGGKSGIWAVSFNMVLKVIFFKDDEDEITSASFMIVGTDGLLLLEIFQNFLPTRLLLCGIKFFI